MLNLPLLFENIIINNKKTTRLLLCELKMLSNVISIIHVESEANLDRTKNEEFMYMKLHSGFNQ
jgi:hypothetical protein